MNCRSSARLVRSAAKDTLPVLIARGGDCCQEAFPQQAQASEEKGKHVSDEKKIFLAGVAKGWASPSAALDSTR